MITHSIKQPGYLQSAKNIGERIRDHLLERNEIQQHPIYNRNMRARAPNAPMSPILFGSKIKKVPWSKLQFTMWLEGIKAHHEVGELLTLNQIPVIKGVAPFHFKLTFINELYHDVEFDLDIQQPIAFTVQTMDGKLLNKCPAVLRKLTKEEIACVNLQNPKQGD
jgi:hypothetical protein